MEPLSGRNGGDKFYGVAGRNSSSVTLIPLAASERSRHSAIMTSVLRKRLNCAAPACRRISTLGSGFTSLKIETQGLRHFGDVIRSRVFYRSSP